jgi:hypothetical protein
MRDVKPQVFWLRRKYDPGKPGRAVTDADYDLKLSGDCDVYKPDGSRLMSLRCGVLSEEAMEAAWPILYKARTHKTSNRGIAAGGERHNRVRKDGTVSKTTIAEPVPSMILGYYDRYPRIPYCRQTAVMADNVEQWKAALPLLDEVAAAYKEAVPDRYEAQMAKVAQTSPDFVITGTPWTTLTVNHNWQTHLHTDRGDWIGEGRGYGTIFALTRGEFTGGTLVYPAYRVAADLRPGDVLFMDSHEWHANTPLEGVEGTYDRVSVVAYYRSKMGDCGSAAEELERAKQARGAL